MRIPLATVWFAALLAAVSADGKIPGESCWRDGQCASNECLGWKCCASPPPSNPPCSSCDSGGKCNACDRGYVLQGGSCVAARLKTPGESCLRDGQCASNECLGWKCCASPPPSNPPCSSCDSGGKCNACDRGYVLQGGSCVPAPLKTPGESCQRDGQCASKKCLGGKCCQNPPQFSPTCNSCDSSGNCNGCKLCLTLKDGACIREGQLDTQKCIEWAQQQQQDVKWWEEVKQAFPCPCDERAMPSHFKDERSIIRTLLSKLPCMSYVTLEANHPGASTCYRAGPTANGYGQQCCYDASGRYISSGPGGGTMDRVYPSLPLKIFQHQTQDVKPFQWCGGPEGWATYTKARPTSECVNIPVTPAPTPTPTPAPPPRRRRSRRRRGCFPPDALARLTSGEEKKLGSLSQGDVLETFSADGELVQYSAFVLDFHAPNKLLALFREVNHSFGSLSISPEHLIFSFEEEGFSAKPAFKLLVGDTLLVRAMNGSLVRSQVLALAEVHRPGVRAPLSSSGTLFVDSVAVSSYGLQHGSVTYSKLLSHPWLRQIPAHAHELSHLATWPLRMAHHLSVTLAVCRTFPSLCQEEHVYPGDAKMHWYVGASRSVFDSVVLFPLEVILG